MKKFVILLILLVINSITVVYAEGVEEKTARKVAVNWYQHHAPVSKQQASISKVKEYKWGDRTSFFICSFDKGGFVLVSANDAVTPVLGYGFDYPVPDSITNEAVKGWFDGYARQIDTAFVLNLKSNEASAKWNEVLLNNFPKLPGDTVGPLLTTTWDQGCYYNEMCPADPIGQCGYTWVGCTATAMSQILKFWNYPESGVGYNSYVPNQNAQYGTQSVFFNMTDYDWNSMPNMVTMQNTAVSTLMYHCGVSSSMDFSTSGSAAYLTKATEGFKLNFDFSDSVTNLKRYTVTDSLWIQTLKQNIDLGRPMLLEGGNSTNTSSHAFVCDGYQSSNYFHMNWGWSGSYNGYWLIDYLLPSWFNFNNNQSAIINIFPNNSVLSADLYAVDKDIPLMVQFVDNSRGNPDTFQWDFGDSTFSMAQNPIHIYSDSGNYLVRLIVERASSHDTVVKQIKVRKKTFSLTSVAMGGNDGKILAIDYNLDGFQDVTVFGGSPHKLYQNNAGIMQEALMNFAPNISCFNIHATDIDNDGDPDLLLDGESGSNGLLDYLYFLNNDSSVFTIDTLTNIPLFTDDPFSFADFNNDGKTDLLLGNQLHRNLGNRKFVFHGLIGTDPAISAWDDYDLDGDMDVAIGSKIFTNQGDGTFTDAGIIFSNCANTVSNSWFNYNIEWGDADQDGKPDLLAGGSIVKNLGNHIFQQIFIDTTQGNTKNSIWGDIDNDGDLDIISINSYSVMAPPWPQYLNCSTKIFINNNGSYMSEEPYLQSVMEWGSIDWIDYDHDNKLDLLLTGVPERYMRTTQLYKNNCDSLNFPPTVPTGLASVVTGNNAVLSWNQSGDDRTSAACLTYNLRVGSTPYGNEVLSSSSDPVTGIRWVVERGNVGQLTYRRINNLKNGKYYWSVQALDNSFAVSGFTQIDSFNVAGVNLPPELFETNQTVFLNTQSHILLQPLQKTYYDPENDPLQSIKIVSLPFQGNLSYNDLPCYLNQIIPVDSLNQLYYTTNIFSDDYFYVIPCNSNGCGLTNAKINLQVRLFEKMNNLNSGELSLFTWGDFDNDGDLDLASLTKIYKNNNGIFQELGVTLSGSGNVNWGDIDADEDLDLTIGEKVFKNIGNDQFINNQTITPGIIEGASAFGDLYTQNILDYCQSGVDINSGNLVTKIYPNSGQGVFSDITINLLGFRTGAVAWGDFDNDGDLDLALSGIYNANNQRKTIIYRNDNGQFTEILANLPGVNLGTLDWGDFDRDGDLDLLLSGSLGTVYDIRTKIFRNDQGTFTDLNTWQIPGSYRGFAKWIDIDADGSLDIIMGGFLDYPPRGVKFFLNNNGYTSFTEIPQTGFPNLAFVSCAAGDFNNDGYPDILLSGINENNETVTAIYRNCFGAETLLVNIPPSVPGNLFATQTPTGVNLQWDKSTDNSTPQNTLSYNIFVSRHPDSLFIMSPMANLSTGFRKFPGQGNTSLNNFWHIDSLPLGTYYWSVQAIDNSFAGGPFAVVDSFTVVGNFPVTGTFLYNNSANTLLDSMMVMIAQNNISIDSALTNDTGIYQFPHVLENTYTIEVHSNKPFAGVNATDALKIQRHFAGLETIIEPVRLQAADVNNSNSINGTDALKIKRRFAGMDATFERGDWTFAKPVVGGDTIIINGSNVIQDFYGLCVGDVNGSN
ncbi:MAG: C10 family peptidase, partial [Bacteroidales bacterium]